MCLLRLSKLPALNRNRLFTDSYCVKGCCRDIEPSKAAQLIIDKEESVRLFGHRERCLNAEWCKNREQFILCKTIRQSSVNEMCRFAAVKKLATFSKCGDDGFVNTRINNWKKMPTPSGQP